MDILLSTHGLTAHAASIYSHSPCLMPWEPRGSQWESYDHVSLRAYTPSKWFRSRPSEGVRITRLCEIPRSVCDVPVGPRRCVRGGGLHSSYHRPRMGQGARLGGWGGVRFCPFFSYIIRRKALKGYESRFNQISEISRPLTKPFRQVLSLKHVL